MNEINVRNEILDSIKNTEMTTMESSMDVLLSMSAAYDKAVMIMEYSNADDLSMFSIFQEAEVAAEAKNRSVGYKILMFIPHLLQAFWEFIKKVWNGTIVPAAEEATKKAKSIPEAIREKIDSLLGEDESSLKTVLAGLGITGAALSGLAAGIIAAKRKDASFRTRVSTLIGNTKNFFKVLRDSKANPVWRISLKNMTIKTNLSIETIRDLASNKLAKAFKEFTNLGSNIDDFSGASEKIVAAVNEVRVAPIMLDEPKEYTFNEIEFCLKDTEKGIQEIGPLITDTKNRLEALAKNSEALGTYDKDSTGDNPHAKEMAHIKNNVDKKQSTLTELNKIKDQMNALVICAQQVITFTANIGKEYQEYINIAKDVSEKLLNESTLDYGKSSDKVIKDEEGKDTINPDNSNDAASTDADLVDNRDGKIQDELAGELAKDPTKYKKGDKITAKQAITLLQYANPEVTEDYSIDADKNRIVNASGLEITKPIALGTTIGEGETAYSRVENNGDGTYTVEYAVEDENPDGEETVQESAIEAEINNHWYR